MDEPEPLLPYTPSHTARRARASYLGLEGVAFNALWPLFAGLAASVALSLAFFVGGMGQKGWKLRSLEALAPSLLGYGYLRFLVSGRPPHFKSDLAVRLLSLRLNPADPFPRAFPLLPRLVSDTASSSEPRREEPRRSLLPPPR